MRPRAADPPAACVPEGSGRRGPERRGEARSPCAAEVSWSIFPGGRQGRGRVTNVSRGGIGFETDRPLGAGVAVVIRLAGPVRGGEGVRTVSVAEIKWSRTVETLGRLHCTVGARYYGGQ